MLCSKSCHVLNTRHIENNGIQQSKARRGQGDFLLWSSTSSTEATSTSNETRIVQYVLVPVATTGLGLETVLDLESLSQKSSFWTTNERCGAKKRHKTGVKNYRRLII
jgi:hypothetical protein